MRFKLQPQDVVMLNIAADKAITAGKAASREARKAECSQGEGEADTLVGYAEESKEFLGKMEKSEVELSRGHLMALGTGIRIYYNEVQKRRKADEPLLIATDGHDERAEELRKVARKLRINLQVEIEEEVEAREEELAGAGAGEA